MWYCGRHEFEARAVAIQLIVATPDQIAEREQAWQRHGNPQRPHVRAALSALAPEIGRLRFFQLEIEADRIFDATLHHFVDGGPKLIEQCRQIGAELEALRVTMAGDPEVGEYLAESRRNEAARMAFALDMLRAAFLDLDTPEPCVAYLKPWIREARQAAMASA
jgi:hypothetical protein